jgi:hypothetical protein
MNDGRHTANALRRRQVTAAVVVGGLLVAFGAGYLLARGGDDPTVSANRSSASRATHTRSPMPTVSVTPSPTPTASPDPHALPDGRSFVYAKAVVGSGGAQSLTFDLATFLTDAAAAAAATAHHDESPPPNGYYIVNDNPLLRTIPISPSVSIRYFPSSGPGCCAHAPGTLDGFTAAVNGTAMTDYPDMGFSPWWITLKDGVIVKISQQYLP